jgi:hypothetical protein
MELLQIPLQQQALLAAAVEGEAAEEKVSVLQIKTALIIII